MRKNFILLVLDWPNTGFRTGKNSLPRCPTVRCTGTAPAGIPGPTPRPGHWAALPDLARGTGMTSDSNASGGKCVILTYTVWCSMWDEKLNEYTMGTSHLLMVNLASLARNY